MRKIMALTLSLVMLFSVGCSGGGDSDKTETKESTASAGLSDSASASGDDTVKIGIVASLTHPTVATAGEYTKNGVAIAVEEINESGGILGKPLEVIWEDDAADATTHINAYNKMLENDVAGIVGTVFSSATLAAASVVEEGGIPTTYGGSAASLGYTGVRNLFGQRPSNEITAEAAAKFMLDEQNCKKVGILYCTNDFAVGAKDVIVDYFDSVGADYEMEAYNVGDTDFQAQLIKLESSGCDGFIAWGDDNDLAIICRQVYEMGWDVPRMGSNGLASAQLQVDPEMANGWFVAGDFSPNNKDNKTTMAFAEKYMDRYGMEIEIYSSVFYSGLKMFADVINECGSTDPEAIIDAIYQLEDYEAANGIYNCNEKGQLVNSALILECRDHTTEVLETVVVEN